MMNYTNIGEGLIASDVVLGRATAKLLAGASIPAEEQYCCVVARSHYRGCWHLAARWLRTRMVVVAVDD